MDEGAGVGSGTAGPVAAYANLVERLRADYAAIPVGEPVRLKPHSGLTMSDPLRARLSYVRAILLAGQQRFF